MNSRTWNLQLHNPTSRVVQDAILRYTAAVDQEADGEPATRELGTCNLQPETPCGTHP